MDFAATPYIIYGVHRSDVFGNSMRALSRKTVSNAYAPENQFSLLTAYQGKIRILPELLRLNSCENEVVQTEDVDRRQSFVEWYRDPSAHGEVDAYYQSMIAIMGALGEKYPDRLRDAIQQWTERFVEKKCKKKKRFARGRALHRTMARIGHRIPERVKNKMMPVVNRVLGDRKAQAIVLFKPLMACVDELTSQGCFVQHVELREIEELVIQFHLAMSNRESVQSITQQRGSS